jgi:hypothetical protein
VAAVVEDVIAGWLNRPPLAAPIDLMHWWDRYVDVVESATGGYECSTDECLDRVWLGHVRELSARLG